MSFHTENRNMSAKLKSVFVFPNRMVVVFDTNGEQVPVLQGRWEDVKERLLPLIEKDNPEVNDAVGVVKA